MWLETERLVLRDWREGDASAMHAMGQDRRVMEFLGEPTDLAAAQFLVRGQMLNQSLFGHCFWPVERRTDGELLGFCGVNVGREPIVRADEVEVGWRFAWSAWGQGYALEAARATLDWSWANLDLAAIVSFTVRANARSWRLMERLGMTCQPDRDFDHPDVPEGDPLRPHIHYRIARPALG